MRIQPLQRLITITCLLAFGVGQCVFSTIGVICRDASGQSRIEFVCEKSNQGHCLTSCAELLGSPAQQLHDDQPGKHGTPCEDQPIGKHLSTTRVWPSHSSLDSVLALAPVAILDRHDWHAPTCGCHAHLHSQALARPPNSLAQLRTVIILV